MTTQASTSTKSIDLEAATQALHRAAEMARKIAIDTNTHLVVMEHGKVVHIPAEQLRQQQKRTQAMPVSTHEISHASPWFASLMEQLQEGGEVVLTRQGRKIARLVPIQQDSGETLAAQRRAVLEQFQRAASSKITPGPDAAHSQDFLYDDDGLPA